MAKKSPAVHFSADGVTPFCSVKSASPVMTSIPEEITCKRCLKAIEKSAPNPIQQEENSVEEIDKPIVVSIPKEVLVDEFDWDGEMSDDEWQEHLDGEFANED